MRSWAISDYRELLSMLTVHGLDVGKAFGGTPEITQHDVAAMMRGLDDIDAELLRCKYCLEPIHNLWAYWFTELMDEGWDAEQGEVEALSKITLGEHVSDNRCGGCEGVGRLVIDDQVRECFICNGMGYMYLSNKEIADRLGHKTLSREWEGRVNECRKRLQLWEHNVIQTVVDSNRVNP